MDMNLPEGFLLRQIYEVSPKNPPTEMHLLELMGDNGIGRLGYRRPGAEATPLPNALERSQLLREGAGHNGKVFAALVDSFLATGSGLSGVQPKIVVPERATFPIPNLIVKTSGDDYPGLVANEYLAAGGCECRFGGAQARTLRRWRAARHRSFRPVARRQAAWLRGCRGAGRSAGGRGVVGSQVPRFARGRRVAD